MEDILSATGKGADSVLVYRWERDSSTGVYSLDPLYVPGLPTMDDRSTTIDYVSCGGYSFYNGKSNTVKLRIPPELSAKATQLKKTAVAKNPSWITKLIAHADDHTPLPTVYFGYAPNIGDRVYPIPPSFSPLGLSILNRTTSEQYSNYVSERAKNGLVKELLIRNSSDSVHSFQYHFEEAGAFPANFAAYCYDAIEKKLDTSGTVTIAANSTISRWIVIGDAAFRHSFISTATVQEFSLCSPYPNPSRLVVNIKYLVPFGAQERIRIAIYNTLGKKMWNKNIDGRPVEGVHQITWNGRDHQGNAAGSGLYIIRLIVENGQGKAIRRFEKCATLLR